MILTELKDIIEELISKARIDEALNVLSVYALAINKAQLTQDITILKGSLTEINRQKTLGLISYEDADIKANRLGYSILELLNIEEGKESDTGNSSELKEDNEKTNRMISKLHIQDVEDKKIAQTLLKHQFDVYLNNGLSYNDFWKSKLHENISIVVEEFFVRFKDFDTNRSAVNDFTNHTGRAQVRLYGNTENPNGQQRLRFDEVNYHEIVEKGFLFAENSQIDNGEPLMSAIGIPCENGFQNWHWEYLKLIWNESDKQEENPNGYSFNSSFLEKNITLSIKTTENSSKPLSIFISYSKKDNELREELNTHLASLRRRNIVSNWDDRHIIGGELWDDTIKTKLKEADIILFLVSANFINTDYIWNHEIPLAEEQRKNGKARVIPIILKSCQWTKLDFAKQMALPSKGIPINSFPDRDTAWLEVVESLEKVIHDVLK